MIIANYDPGECKRLYAAPAAFMKQDTERRRNLFHTETRHQTTYAKESTEHGLSETHSQPGLIHRFFRTGGGVAEDLIKFKCN